jgi:uncharacterized protein
MRVAITASTGLIGSALSARLQASGTEVVRLVRRPTTSAGELRWDPSAPGGGLEATALTGLDAVVHLSGAPVAARPWSAARKQELRASRIDSTSALVSAMLATSSPPPVLLAASAIGWYGGTGAREVDETAPSGTGFLAQLVRDWEAATEPARAAGIRVVSLRSGIVLSRRGGMLRPLLLPFRLGLGTSMGQGTQYLSWIAIEDHVRACEVLLGHPVSGPVNLTAPNPVTNAQFTAELARQLHRPALLRAPAAVLRTALGELSTELLTSYRVVPARLEHEGFAFRYPQLGPAIAAALSA